VELLSSEVLIYEGEQSALPIRTEHTFAVLSKAKTFVTNTETIKLLAVPLTLQGINPLDALH